MHSNVFIGESPWRGATPSPTPPSLNLGTSDWAIEFWLKWKFGNSPGDDLYFYSFFLTDSGGFSRPGLAARWNTDSPNFHISVASVGSVSSVTATQQGIWGHYTINMDRDDVLEVFVDNVSEGSSNIAATAAVDMGTVDFYPLIYEEELKLATNQNFGDGPNNWNSGSISPVIMGPIAVHNRIITAAERESSRTSKTVQDLGSSVTQIRYDWTVDGETGWDNDLGHILNAFRVGASTPMGAPTGTEPDVVIVDKSGNGNHYPLPAAASYSIDGANVTEVAASKACVAFGAESFFT
jgi:hypothetical protein